MHREPDTTSRVGSRDVHTHTHTLTHVSHTHEQDVLMSAGSMGVFSGHFPVCGGYKNRADSICKHLKASGVQKRFLGEFECRE